jgi:hypothetical protein
LELMATDFAALAAKLVERARSRGLARIVTLRQLVATPPDPQTPWLPPADPRAGAVTLAVTAVFVDPSSERELGLRVELIDWLKRAMQIAIIASPEDLSTFSELVDDAEVWRVVGVSTLRPGPTRIVHFLGVAR